MPLYTLIPPVTQCINCLDSYLRTTRRSPLDLIIFIYIQGYHYRRSLFSLLHHQFSLSVWFFPSAYKSAIFLPFQKKGGTSLDLIFPSFSFLHFSIPINPHSSILIHPWNSQWAFASQYHQNSSCHDHQFVNLTVSSQWLFYLAHQQHLTELITSAS